MASRNNSLTSSNQPQTEKPKTGLAANPHNPSSAAYLAYPVKHVVSSLYRRMTEPPEQPVNKLLDAPVVNRKSSAYTPPRRASPFQPPPLTPLNLQHELPEEKTDNLLLTKSLAEEIRLLVPPRLQLVDTWRLAYNLELNGSSLSTLYDHCEQALGPLGGTQRGGFVLLVQDGSEAATSGSVFGAYLTDLPKPQQHYFGTGECFLWRASILPSLSSITACSQSQSNGGSGGKVEERVSEDLLELAGLPPPPSADTTNAQRMTTVRGERRRSSAAASPTSPRKLLSFPSPPINGSQTSLRPPQSPSPVPSVDADRIRFKAFPYSGVNDFMMYCQRDYFSVGGGDGHYGLYLSQDLETGISESCPTFGNEPLSEEGKKFDVLGVEIWYIGGA